MVSTSRIQGLNVGVTEIQRWRQSDEQHLPERTVRTQQFLPRPQALDQILRRETLDERLVGYVVPSDIDAELLQPAVMGATREALRRRMIEARDATDGRGRAGAALAAAASLLDTEVALDFEVREALAALLRG